MRPPSCRVIVNDMKTKAGPPSLRRVVKNGSKDWRWTSGVMPAPLSAKMISMASLARWMNWPSAAENGKDALDLAVAQGNKLLRQFERANP